MKVVNYKYEEQKSDEAIELAFNKKKADSRKKWLSEYDRNNVLDYKNSDVTHEDFINKELIHFSNSDNKRSIASMVDGLKTHKEKSYIVYLRKIRRRK